MTPADLDELERLARKYPGPVHDADAVLALIARVRELEDVLSVIASPGSIEDYGNGWAVEKARKALR